MGQKRKLPPQEAQKKIRRQHFSTNLNLEKDVFETWGGPEGGGLSGRTGRPPSAIPYLKDLNICMQRALATTMQTTCRVPPHLAPSVVL